MALAVVSHSARGEINPYHPAQAADPPPQPGSAAPPREDAERASPTAPEKRPSLEANRVPLAAETKRPVPAYHPPDPEHDTPSPWLWIPRAVLAPLYLTSEYLVRRPLGAVITHAEKHHWPARLIDLLTWNDQRAGIVPVVAVDWGFRANAGFYLFWDDLLAKNNDFQLRAEAGGIDWARARLIDSWSVDARHQLRFRAYASTRPDHLYWGMGADSLSSGARFGATDLESTLTNSLQLHDWVRLEAELGARRLRFDASPTETEGPNLSRAVADGSLTLPPGIPGYSTAYEQLGLVIDTRPQREVPSLPPASDFMPGSGSGVRFAASVGHHVELEGGPRGAGLAREWISYSGSLGGYVDLTGTQRTLGLQLTTMFADPFDPGLLIPFTELPALGGHELMRGFKPLRMLGRSAAVAKLDYRWPIWAYLDGTIDVSAGNAFGPHLQGFELDKLRLSSDIGIRTLGSLDRPFEILIGFGTRPLQAGAAIDEIRVVFGGTEVF